MRSRRLRRRQPVEATAPTPVTPFALPAGVDYPRPMGCNTCASECGRQDGCGTRKAEQKVVLDRLIAYYAAADAR